MIFSIVPGCPRRVSLKKKHSPFGYGSILGETGVPTIGLEEEEEEEEEACSTPLRRSKRKGA